MPMEPQEGNICVSVCLQCSTETISAWCIWCETNFNVHRTSVCESDVWRFMESKERTGHAFTYNLECELVRFLLLERPGEQHLFIIFII